MAKTSDIKITIDAEAFIEALNRATEAFERLAIALKEIDG